MTGRTSVFGLPDNRGDLEPAYEALYLDTLRPFDDDDLFVPRIMAPNRFLRKNPELRDDILDTLQDVDDQSILDTVELLNLSRDIDSPPNRSPIGAIFDHLTLCGEINATKVDHMGFESPTDRANALMYLAQRHLTDSVDDDEVEKYWMTAKYMDNRLSDQPSRYPFNAIWYRTKLRTIEHGFGIRLATDAYLDQLPGPDSAAVSLEQARLESAEIEQLFGRARQGQRYGVKLGYIKQQNRPGSLVFSPPPELTDLRLTNGVHALTNQAMLGSLCVVADSGHKGFKKRVAFVNERGDNPNDLAYVDLNVESRALLVLGPDGELGTAAGRPNLLTSAIKRGKYQAYRRLQAEVMADYIDLTTALSIRPGDDTQPKPASLTESTSKQPGVEVVRRLLLPRIRAIDQTNGPAGVDGESLRQVSLHGVVWHIRRLPPDWRASPAAQELAAQAGIKLAERETFVRPYVRGSKKIGQVVLHQLGRRPRDVQ